MDADKTTKIILSKPLLIQLTFFFEYAEIDFSFGNLLFFFCKTICNFNPVKHFKAATK